MSDLYTALSEQQQQELKLTGDAVRSRRQLSYFESHLSRIRQLLTTANGYFETYSIRKRALPSAMMALLDAVQLHKEGQPLPEDLRPLTCKRRSARSSRAIFCLMRCKR
jgi:hypothetical protein